MTTCPKCGIPGGERAAHLCGDPLPNGYVELDRPTDVDIAIEVEAKRLGVHPKVLALRRQAERDAEEQETLERIRATALARFNERYGFNE